MKANKAPEKIYLEAVYPDNGVLPNGLNYTPSPTDIEYIRADAFIEKTAKWIDNNIYAYIEIMQPTVDSQTYINRERLILDFKKVMRR